MSRRSIRRLGVAAGLLAATAPAAAAPLEFSGQVQGRAGYASNPFLRPNVDRGSASLGGQLLGTVTKREATSVTAFTGSYTRDEYLNGYSASESLTAELSRDQTFSSTLNGNARVYYDNSRNAFTDPVDDLDIVTAGRRRKTIGGEAGLTAALSARDSAGVTAFGNHTTYSSGALGNYDQYGATGFYSHVFTENTTAGVSMTVSRTENDIFGDTTTYQPNLTLRQRLSPQWLFDGSVGIIFQKTEFRNNGLGAGSDSSKSLGFNGNLCGTYPTWTLCFSAARQTSASGFGGLRTQTSGSVRYTQRVDERSRFNASISGGRSTAPGGLFNLIGRRQTYFAADLGYDYDLTQRISIGAQGDYRLRKFDGIDSASGYSAVATLTVRFGRVR